MRYALALAEYRHFGRTAAALGIRQPALSQQIKRLEEDLGVRLFERGGRGVEPTAAGQAFCADAWEAVQAAERAERAARRAVEGANGRLRIGYVGSAMYWLLPKAVRVFRERYPDADLSLAEMASVQQAEAITSGELDLGLLRVPLPARWPQLHYRSLPRERLMVALTAGHPLAADSSVPIIRLAKIPLVMVSRHLEPASHDQIIQLCHKAGFQPRVEAQEDQVGSVLGLVAAGVGVAIGPESLSRLRRDDVEYRLLAPRTFIPSLAVCHDRRAPTPIQRNFENVLRSITLPAS